MATSRFSLSYFLDAIGVYGGLFKKEFLQFKSNFYIYLMVENSSVELFNSWWMNFAENSEYKNNGCTGVS